MGKVLKIRILGVLPAAPRRVQFGLCRRSRSTEQPDFKGKTAQDHYRDRHRGRS